MDARLDAGRIMIEPALLRVLERSQQMGFLGPGDVAFHVEHAMAFAEVLGPDAERVLDLGTGGGIPGLVLLARQPGLTMTLLDANTRRCDFVRSALDDL